MRHHLTLLLLSLFSLSLSAQSISRFSSRQPGWWTLGLDGGSAFQTSDVRTQWKGGGFGLTLGKNLAYRPGGLFSFDARGRLLFSRTFGADYKRSYGIQKNKSLNGTHPGSPNYLIDLSSPNDSSFVYANYKHNMGELGLEGVLTFNRLRERTGIVFSLFGGLGLDIYKTRTDQATAGSEYNYLNISPNSSKRSILADLNALRDGSYETDADGTGNDFFKAGFMPGAGLELGYQVTQHFVIGVGHKITFSRTDALDGQRWTDANQATDGNDWHHYTNLHFRWDLGGRTHKAKAPEIEITWPEGNPTTTPYRDATVRAKIRNVNSYSDVQCTLNGSNQPFRFERGLFSTSAQLRPGRNEVRIRASNAVGQDEATVVINWVDDRVTPPPPPPPPPPPSAMPKPEVHITQPARSPQTTNRDNISIHASVRNVENRRNVRLTVNGTDQSFNFAEDLEANVRLREGKNQIRVEASNESGRAWDEVEVIYQRDEPAGRKPKVTLTQPRSGSDGSNDAEYTVKAEVQNVDSRDDITVYVNGNQSRNFSYNAGNGALSTTITLKTGENDVTIRAKNRYGEDEASCIIRKNGGLNLDRKPEVRITQPTDGEKFTQADADLKASVKNTSERSQIRVTLNGKSFTDFDYDKARQSISARLKLSEGDNTITVRATTTEGSDEASVRVNYKAPSLPKPELRIVDPATAGTTVKSPAAKLRATTKNISSRNDIRVELNRRSISFNFDPGTGDITADLSLSEGENPIFVSVQNSAGSAEASSSIRYEKAPAPEVKINKPANNAELPESRAILQATVSHVAKKSDITVQLNGRSIEFEFNNRNGDLSANLSLNEGANSVRVAARTTDGADEASITVRYLKAKAPVVEISKPLENAEFSVAEADLVAQVSNVGGKNDIKVQANGRDLSFDFAAGKVSAKVPLNEGANSIRVSATTNAGTDAASVMVRYIIKGKPPVVRITTPKDQSVTDQPECTLNATLENVTGLENVELTLNKAVIRNFSIDKGGNLSVKLTLKEGKNAIRVKGSNKVGSDVAAVEVTLTPRLSLDKPGITITDPGKFRAKSSKTPYDVKATVTRAEKSGIKVFVNGTQEPNFNFDAKSTLLTFKANLKEGANTIKIEATNAAGSTNASASVTYTAPSGGGGSAPEVKIESASQPTVSPFTPNQAKTQVVAKTKNVTDKSQITCTLDGKAFTDFSFDTPTGTINFIATVIRHAENLIEITVTTPDGTNKASTKVKFE